MFLRFVKEISIKDAGILREAKEKERVLLNLIDANFLCDDLVGKDEILQNMDERIKPVVKDVGKFLQPEFGIINERFIGDTYRRIINSKKDEYLYFSIGTRYSVPGINFNLQNYGDPRDKFASGTFFERKYDNKNYILDGIVFRIASYFHDKKELYSAIFKFLTEYKEQYSKIASTKFIDDLILLFSVDYNFEDIPSFDIFPIDKKELFLEKENTRKDWLYIGKESFYPKKYVDQNWFHPELQTDLWLNENKLIFNTNWVGWSNYSDEAFKKKIAEEEFKQFIDENLTDWLKHIVLTTDFGIAIYKKVKTKIFLGNI